MRLSISIPSQSISCSSNLVGNLSRQSLDADGVAGNQSANYVPKQLIGLTWHKKRRSVLSRAWEFLGKPARMSPTETLSFGLAVGCWLVGYSFNSTLHRPGKATWVFLSSHMSDVNWRGKVACRLSPVSPIACRLYSNLKTAECTENLIKKGFSACGNLLGFSLTWPLSIFLRFSVLLTRFGKRGSQGVKCFSKI